MIQIDLPTLVKRLNLFSRQALEMAASECMSQQAAEITVSHVLIQMLAMPRSDLRVITRQGDIGMEELRQALTVENYTTARSADSYPAFSPMLVEWLKEGWLLASAEMQHSELRGGVLLLALLHSPLRYICNFAFFSGLISAQFWAGRSQPKSPELGANLLVMFPVFHSQQQTTGERIIAA